MKIPKGYWPCACVKPVKHVLTKQEAATLAKLLETAVKADAFVFAMEV